uniref:Lipocalin/cytosolic fatty-acid binding domain-containing protein n=1 Tax=Equus asinus TaxID=9793 RepID=A0A8C4LS38_EQUAS
MEPPSGKDSLPVTIEESVLSPARMKLLLLCLGLILVCAQQEENNDVAIRNFDISKWYSIFVASDLEEKVEENGSMRIFVELIYALDNSSLYFKFQTNSELCSFSSIDDGYNVFRISQFGDSTYIIVYLANFNKDRPYQVLEFYAREPDVSPELKEEFVEIAQRQGIVKENIIDLTKIDRCFQIRGSGVSQA